MVRNYLKIAFRNLIRQKGYSIVNIAGLSIGLAFAFLIVLWIGDELSYDRFHESGDRIYRVRRHVQFEGDQIYTQHSVPWPLAHVLEEEYPEVQNVVLTTWEEDHIVKRRDISARENGLHASLEFFEIFSWNLIQGEPAMVLQNPESVVLSASLAEKYFGPNWRESALGGTVQIENYGNFTVTGIFSDVPGNSSLQFDFVLPMEAYVRHQNYANLNNWSNSSLLLYIRLREEADWVTLSEKITNLQNDHIEGFKSDLFLQPYTDQHIYSMYKNGVLTVSRIEYYIRIFAIVAIMVVLIGCINFMNLATAHSMRRAREVGIRKAIGVGRRALAGQFMGESLLLVSIAFVLAMGFVAGLLPVFNNLTGKEVTTADLDGGMFLIFSGIGLLAALFAGTYPAFYLSSFDAVSILGGTFSLGSSGTRLRKGLVVFQFTMSILLVVGTITVYKQIRYIDTKDLGLDRENVIYIPREERISAQFETIKEELLRRPGIESVTAANASPLNVTNSTHSVSWPEKSQDSEIEFQILSVTFDYLKTMKIILAEGRDFNPAFGRDSVNFIINETAREVMGSESLIGKRLSFWGDNGTIIGVAKDFHMTSLYNEIQPTIIRLRPQQALNLYVRTRQGQTSQALANLKEVYKKFVPGHPFEPRFLDEDFDQMYQSETAIGKLVGYFTAIALFITCLGLFGLASFSAQRRTKEIGIRKVIGASIASVVALLTRDFIRLVIIAFVIATPIAWYAMNRWLQGFAYRIELQWWIFAGAGLVTAVIAMVTVTGQSVRAALANPTKSLRTE